MNELNRQIQEKFAEMQQTGKLFRSSITGQQVWDLWLKSFSREDDPIFRDPNSSTHNCNHCNNFIRRYGNVVSIDSNNSVVSMFEVAASSEYKASCEAISKALKEAKVVEVFFETFDELKSLPYESCSKTSTVFQLGVAENVKRYTKEEAELYGVVQPNEIRRFTHLNIQVAKQFVDMSGNSVEQIMGAFRDAKNVFQRAMETISLDTYKLVRDLINQGSLLDGTAHLHKIEQIIPLKEAYDNVDSKQRDNWCWVNSYRLPFAKFRNELIGVLCSELSEGEELNKACQSWNKRVDPANYMKAVAPITQRQIEEAKRFVEENGYVESFNRRFATIDDIKVSEILHSNVGNGSVKAVSIFDGVKSTSTRHKRSEFDKVETVSIDKFMTDILPGCTSIEAFLTSQQKGNLVSLTTAGEDSKRIFKWGNPYSWTFNGNLAGKSQIKEAVKTAGGNVTGVLRASMIWNESGNDQSDLDLWCSQPDRVSIGYSTSYRRDRGGSFTACGGQLDLDNTNPGSKQGVENIYFTDLGKLKEGVYKFWVNQFANRGSQGFRFEIEFEGELYQYRFDRPVYGNVEVAYVTFKKGEFSIEHKLPVSEGFGTSQELYGLETNKFHKVNLVCLSPNHWGDNCVGNKHYFFMLEGCKSPTAIRSFHAENLLPELAQHRKVLEVLGATNMIEPADKQLSGLGFNSTVSDTLVVRLQGTHKRVVKIQF